MSIEPRASSAANALGEGSSRPGRGANLGLFLAALVVSTAPGLMIGAGWVQPSGSGLVALGGAMLLGVGLVLIGLVFHMLDRRDLARLEMMLAETGEAISQGLEEGRAVQSRLHRAAPDRTDTEAR